MKKLTIYFAMIATTGILLTSRPAQAYFGFNFGLADNDQFGYGLSFGLYTPDHFGLDMQVVSTYDSEALFNRYWIQNNFAITYDLNHLIKDKGERFTNTHPYFKLGFAYGMNIVTSFSKGGIEYGGRLSDGPGLLFGGGCDWKFGPAGSVGIDLYENVLWLDKATAGGVVLADDGVHWGFNLLMTVKAYDFL